MVWNEYRRHRAQKTEESLKEARDSLEEKVKERTKELDKAYNLLKESEGRLAEAQRIAHIGNLDWNIITNRFYWSDEIYRIFGCPPQEFGENYDEFLRNVHPGDRERVNDAVIEALKGKKSYEIDHRIILDNGKERIVHEKGEVTFNENNTPVRMLGTVQDITERKNAEEVLKLKLKELARSNAELEQFAYVSSHDLQEALWMITGYLQLLQERYQGNLDDKADKYINFAVDGA